MKKDIAQSDFSPAPVATDLETLGAALRSGRARRGETQKALAARLRLSANTVGAAERGMPGVGVGVYATLAWALGLPGLSDAMPALRDSPQRVRGSGAPIDDF